MSKLHVTSGTKTCNRLKSILLFPCDKMKHRIQKSLHQHPKTGHHQTFPPAAQHPNQAWKPKSSSSLAVFLPGFTVDRGSWMSQAWQEPSWGDTGTRLRPLGTSQLFSPRLC